MQPRSIFMAIIMFTVMQGVAWVGWSVDFVHGVSGWGLAGLIICNIIVLCITTRWVWRVAGQMIGGVQIILRLAVTLIAIWAMMQMINHAARATQNPPPAPAALAIFPIERTHITIDGTIGFDMFETLERTLAAHPQVEKMTINSMGGRIPAARGMARLIREARLDTHVETTCASACTIVFIAGQRRTMGRDAKIGFHQYRLMSTVGTMDANQEQDADVAAFLAQGVAAIFMEQAMAVGHDDMWFPTRAHLQRAGITTQ